MELAKTLSKDARGDIARAREDALQHPPENEMIGEHEGSGHDEGEGNCKERLSHLCQDNTLQKIIDKGVAFHTAALDLHDRRVVERGFLSGRVRLLVCTTTLALGVNLPAAVVLIKNTRAYRGAAAGGYADITVAEVLQMCGRAGREGYDSVWCSSDNNAKALRALLVDSKNDFKPFENSYERCCKLVFSRSFS